MRCTYILIALMLAMLLISGCTPKESKIISQTSCEIGKQYVLSTSEPFECKCPEGYGLRTISQKSDSCFSETSDCSEYFVECASKTNGQVNAGINAGAEKIIDCGSNAMLQNGTRENLSNFDCFIKAAQTCSPAKLINAMTVNILGMIDTATGLVEIKGMDADKCVLYQKTLNNGVKISDEFVQVMLDAGSTKEQISQAEQTANENAQLSIGKDGTCKYPIEDLIKMLEAEKQGVFSFSTDDMSKYQCTGSMYSSI